LDNPVHKIPTLRITIAFAMGILLADRLQFSSFLIFAISLISAGTLLLINRNYSYRNEPVFGWLVFLLYIFLGAMLFQQYNTPPKFFDNGRFAATVLEKPEEKKNSFKSILKITAVYSNDSIFVADETVLAYFEKDDAAKNLKPGQTLLFQKVPEMIRNNGNPYEFDYKGYLARKKIFRSIYLAKADWKLSELRKFSAKIIAEQTREKLLAIYRSQKLGENETAILSALTLGYKRGLDPETKRIFSSAGAMHVLAVSGLHVGIVFGVFILFFGFLRKQKFGKFIFIILAILILWSYAFITGLSPSVMRAATMFSLVVIATNVNRRASIYNSLAASALLLLIINPNNLFEVGFQLSYAAVFGIVYLQPKIEYLWPVQNKLLRFFWTLLTVSIAAQVATFPITSFYFNQFPLYFWISNLVVIPAAFILIALGITLLAFSTAPFLGPFLAFATKWVIKLVYTFLSRIEDLPFSVQEINLTKTELIFLLIAFISGLIYIDNTRARYIKVFLASFLLIGFANLYLKYQQLQQTELIVYNHYPGFIVHLIKGEQNYVLTQNTVSKLDYVYRQIETVRQKKGLLKPKFLNSHEAYRDEYLLAKNGIFLFGGKTIWLESDEKTFPKKLHPDYVLSKKARTDFPEHSEKPLFISNGYPDSSSDSQIFYLRREGALYSKW